MKAPNSARVAGDRCAASANDEHADGDLFVASGPVRAIALEILAEWRLAQRPRTFRNWFTKGAPSDGAEKPG